MEHEMPANKIFGLVIEDFKEGFAKIHVPFKEEFIGDFIQRRWHGGILASIADTTGGIVCASLMNSPSDRFNTIDMRVDYLHGAMEKDVMAEGRMIKLGKRIIKVDISLFQEKADPVAVARISYSVLKIDN